MEHTIATIFLPRSYCQTYIPKIPGFGVVFQQDGALAHRARNTVAFLERKVPDFVSPTLWSPNSPDLNPDNNSIWMLECRPYAVSKLMEIGQSSDRFFTVFLRNCKIWYFCV